MKVKIIFFIKLILFFLATQLHSQTAPYILGEQPTIFSTIEHHLSQGEIDSALILTDNILQNESDERILGIAYFYKGQIEILMGQYDIAEYSFETAVRIFKSANFEKGLAMLYCKNADLKYFQGAIEEADDLYNLSIDYSEKLNLYEPLIDAYKKKAIIYTSNQEPEVAIEFSKIALKYALLKKDQDEVKNLINQISTNYHSNGQLDSAIVYFQKGLQLKQEMNDSEGLIGDYIALGNLFRERGGYEKAQEQFMQALSITETEKDTFSMMTIYSEMGDIYAAQNMWNVAEEYYNKTLQLARSKNSHFMEAGAYKKLGNIFQLQKKDIAAVENYEAAFKKYEQLKNKINAADILMRLSQIYKNDGQFIKVKNLLLEALENSSRSQDMMSTLTIKCALAEIEIKLGNHQKGIAYAEECLSAYGEMEDKGGLRQVYSLLAEAYAQISDFKKAYQYQLNFNIVNDSLMSIDRAVAIKKYDFLYTTEKKDKEIAQQKLEIEKQRENNNRKVQQERQERIYLIISGFVLLLILSGVYFRLRYMNKSKTILQDEKDRSDSLLLNILPEEIANELKAKGKAEARDYDQVSILFTDFKGFTQISEQLSAKDLVAEINHCFKAFDAICGKYGVEKIKTIGDSYMASGGLPVPSDDSVKNTVLAALDMQAFIADRITVKRFNNEIPFEMRLGIHTGPVVAGIVGVKKFQYDIWGDTVNTASRMESSGEVGRVNITQETYKIIKDDTQFTFVARGKIHVKGKGEVEMYFVKRI